MIFPSQFHLKGGVTITEAQASKIFNAKSRRASLAIKETAQALWGTKVLLQRTYGGQAAPKDRKNPDVVTRKELTPEKVHLVVGG